MKKEPKESKKTKIIKWSTRAVWSKIFQGAGQSEIFPGAGCSENYPIAGCKAISSRDVCSETCLGDGCSDIPPEGGGSEIFPGAQYSANKHLSIIPSKQIRKWGRRTKRRAKPNTKK